MDLTDLMQEEEEGDPLMRAQNNAPTKHARRQLSRDNGGGAQAEFRQYDFDLVGLAHQSTSSERKQSKPDRRVRFEPNVEMYTLAANCDDLEEIQRRKYPYIAHAEVLGLAISVEMADLFVLETSYPKTMMENLVTRARIGLGGGYTMTSKQSAHLKSIVAGHVPFGLEMVADAKWRSSTLPSDETFFARFPEAKQIGAATGYVIPPEMARQIQQIQQSASFDSTPSQTRS